MPLPTTSLLAILAAVQLTSLVVAGPLPVPGGLHTTDVSCNDDRKLDAGCKTWPFHGFSRDIADPRVKRGGNEPIIPVKPEPIEPAPEPVTPEPITVGGPAPIDPLAGGEPVVVNPEPAPVTDSATDAALEPLGTLRGNDPNFNGYSVSGPNKAVTALEDAILTNKPDVKEERYDIEIKDPNKKGKMLVKYRSRLTPSGAHGPGEQVAFFPRGPLNFFDVKAERFQDPDINLPISVKLPTGGNNLAAKWARIDFSSEKGANGASTNPEYNIVAEVYANQDGSAIVVSDTNASLDFNDPATADATNRRLSSSELIFQAGEEIHNPGTTSALRVFMRQNVINKGATNTIKQAYQSLGLSLKINTRAVFESSAGKGTAEGKAFAALMQVKNSEGTNFALGDHHQAFGDKMIQKIVTFLSTDFTDVTYITT